MKPKFASSACDPFVMGAQLDAGTVDGCTA